MPTEMRIDCRMCYDVLLGPHKVISAESSAGHYSIKLLDPVGYTYIPMHDPSNILALRYVSGATMSAGIHTITIWELYDE